MPAALEAYYSSSNDSIPGSLPSTLSSLSHAAAGAASPLAEMMSERKNRNGRRGEIAETPKRGRRVQNVHFGWETPQEGPGSSSQYSSSSFPHSQQQQSVYASPSELVAASFSQDSRKPSRSTTSKKRSAGPAASSEAAAAHQQRITKAALLDMHGWATARSLQQQPDASALAYLVAAGDDVASSSLIGPDASPDQQELQLQSNGRADLRWQELPRFDTDALLDEFLVSFKSDPAAEEPSSWSSASLPASSSPHSHNKMVGVHIEGMGRVVVGKDLAPQLSKLRSGSLSHPSTSSAAPATESSRATAANFAANEASSSSCSSDTTSDRTQFTEATTVEMMTPYLSGGSSATTSLSASGPSPSFSITSQFPASECGSPSLLASQQKAANGSYFASIKPAKMAILPIASSASASAPALPLTKEQKAQQFSQRVKTLQNLITKAQSQTPAASKPGIAETLADSQTRLPQLQWPDSLDGPWSGTIEEANKRRVERLERVRMWLRTASDESEEEEEADLQLLQLRQAAAALEAEEVLYGGAPTASQESVSRQLLSIAPAAPTDQMRHPMVAKALADRARKLAIRKAEQAAIAAESVAALPQQAIPPPPATEKKRGKGASREKSSKSSKRRKLDDEKYMALSTPLPLSRHDASAAFIGCFCGLSEGAAPMVQCDTCERWYHMPCVGFKEEAAEEADGWHCHGCVMRNSATHTPISSAMSVSGGSGLTVLTPSTIGRNLRRSGGSVSQSGEPVFVQPLESPLRPRSVALASALALAPSPPMLGSARFPNGKRGGAGRSRAERFGWQMTEPGSPLDRKSAGLHSRGSSALLATPIQAHLRNHTSRREGAHAHHTPSAFAGVNPSEWEAHLRLSTRDQLSTPRASVSGVGQSQSHEATQAAEHVAASSFHPSSALDHVDDIFSTPSRLGEGSAWTSSAAHQPVARTPMQNVHRRESSNIWGLPGCLSTPSRDFLGGAFSTEHSAYSVGLPSLVYSSGGLDHRDLQEHNFPAAAKHEDAHSARWLLQSPTSSTRAVRARNASHGVYQSVLRTPEVHRHAPLSPSLSSVRDASRQSHASQARSAVASSSPMIKTPRGDYDDRHVGGALSALSGVKVPASSKRFAQMSGARTHADQDSENHSFDATMGLGIGLDLDTEGEHPCTVVPSYELLLIIDLSSLSLLMVVCFT